MISAASVMLLALLLLMLMVLILGVLFFYFKKDVSRQLFETKKTLDNMQVTYNNFFKSTNPFANSSEDESGYVDVLDFLSSAIKNHIDNVVGVIRFLLGQSDCSKIAAFFIAIGSKLSVEIFKNLQENEVEIITFEVACFEKINSEQRTTILKEFYELFMANQYVFTGGIDYARVLLEKSFGTMKAIDIINRLTLSLKTMPFDFVRRVEPMHLLNFIQQEHPQIIALILSHLEPDKSAIILEKLPSELQEEIIRRIATMKKTSPETCRDIERELEKKLSTLSIEDEPAVGGLESAVKILSLINSGSEKQIIKILKDKDPKLADKIEKSGIKKSGDSKEWFYEK
ncbi:MAG: flagellar motor switch protein FliG [Spirochaetaceae bacterium]|nr:flagellar motor switch protein FliG [Spirochaetaceae bacterium]